MKRTLLRKWLIIMLTVILCCSMYSKPVFATEQTQDGLIVSLTTDKTSYSDDEKLVATLTVKNTNDTAVHNISLESLIPEGYVLAEGSEKLKSQESLAAGETVTLTVEYVAGETEPSTDAPPATGDKTNRALWSIVLIASAAGLICVVIKNKQSRRVLSLFLCLVMIVPWFEGVVVKADDQQTNGIKQTGAYKIEIETKVSVNSNQVTIKGVVKYDLVDSTVDFSTFYKVNFDYPAGMTEDAINSIFFAEEQLVYAGSLVYAMPEPYSQSYMFAGWYYDSELKKEAGLEDVITADTVLYPKMVRNDEPTDGYVTNNYVSDLNVTDLNKSVTVKAPSRQAVLDGLVFVDVTAGSKELEFTVTDNNDGTYTIKAKQSLEGGKTYQLRAKDREEVIIPEENEDLRERYIRFIYNGEVQTTDVCYYNIFTDREEVNNLQLNDGIEFISVDKTQGLDMDSASSLYTIKNTEEGKMDIETNKIEGTFTYNGTKSIAVGDVIAIYEGDSEVEEEYANYGTAAKAENTAFVEILSIDGNVYSYRSANIEDVLLIPDVLPIPEIADEDGNSEDNTITIDNKYLDYRYLGVESVLSEDTVAEEGDFVALYQGSIENPGDIAYGRITNIATVGDKTTIQYDIATLEEVKGALDSYIYNKIPVDIPEEEQIKLENEIVKQGVDSGFAEKAAAFAVQEKLGLSETPVWGRSYQLTREQASTLEVDIEHGEVDAGTFMYMLRFDPPDVNADITTNLKRITTVNDGKGVRIAFGVYIPVGIEVVNIFTNEVDESLNMDLYVTFEQEFAFDITASVDYDVELFLGFIPIDVDLVISASFDIGTYTGIGAVVSVNTQKDQEKSYIWNELVDDDGSNGAFTSSVSLAEQLNAMLEGGDTTFFDEYKDENGRSTLVEEYQKMLQTEVDYIDILAIPIYKFKGYITPTTPVAQYLVEPELVFAAKLNVMLGTSLESLNVKQFGFVLDVFEGKAWANPVVDKQTPYHSFNLLMLGNVGFRAGVRVTASIGLVSLKLANIGAMIELGIYADLYGFGYYHYDWKGSRTDGKSNPNIQSAGAFYLEIGFYLDFDIFAAALMDLLSVNVHMLELQVPIFKLGNREYICAVELPQTEYQNGDYFRLPDAMYRIKTFDIKTGEMNTYPINRSNFTVTIPDEYKDIIKFDEYTYDGRLSHFFYFVHDKDKLSETAKVNIVYKPSMEANRSSKADSLYDLIGEVSQMLTINWSRDKKEYGIYYNGNKPEITYTDTYSSMFYPGDLKQVAKFYEGDAISKLASINENAAELEGYDFAGWKVKCYKDDTLNGKFISDISELEGYKMPLCDINLYPVYTPREDTKFTVRHLVPSLTNPEEYEVFQEEVFYGRTGSFAGEKLEYYISSVGLDMDASKLPINTWVKNEKGETIYIRFGELIRHDGSSVLDLYYERESCYVTLNANNPDYVYYGTEPDKYSSSVKFGDEVKDPGYALTEIPGYTFVGWSTTADGSSGISEDLPSSLDFTAQEKSKGITYYAIWEPEEIDTLVRYYILNGDGEYEYVDCEYKSVMLGTKFWLSNFKPEEVVLSESAFGQKIEAFLATDKGLVNYGRDYVYYADETLVVDVYYGLNYSKVYIKGEMSQYAYGTEITLPVDEKQGYVFVGWESIYENDKLYSAGDKVVVNQSSYCFVPKFVEADDTPYKVEHYLEDTFGEYPEEPTETETLYGTTGSYVSPEPNTYTGFETLDAKKVKIEADGSTVIKYYYERKTYDISVDFEIDGENLILRGQYKSTYKYGTPFMFSDPYNNPIDINREGYRIVGWYLADEELNPEMTLLDEDFYMSNEAVLVSEKDLTFMPMWEKVPCEYVVEHYLEQLDGSFALQQTDKNTSTINEVVTATEMEFAGFTVDKTIEGTVTSGTITSVSVVPVLKLYYTRNSYEVKWYAYDGSTLLATTDVLYQDAAVPPTSYEEDDTRTGYTLLGWKNVDYGKVTRGGVSFTTATYGDWKANSYTVKFDAGEGSGLMEDQDFDYDVEQQLSPNQFTYAGHVFMGWATERQGEVVYKNKELVKNLASSGAITLYAVWELGDEYAYKVEHYIEELDGSFSLYDTEDFTALVDSEVTAGQISIEGFTYDADNENAVITGIVVDSGELTLKLYYSRNSYQLTFDFNGESRKHTVSIKDPANSDVELYREVQTVDVEDEVFTLKYGQTLADITEVVDNFAGLTFDGYTFEGWFNGETEYDGSETMPAEGLVLTASWEPITITVTYHPGAQYLGGTTEATQLTYTYSYGDVITEPDVLFTSTMGYEVAGWIFNNGSGGIGQYPIISSWPLELVYGYHSLEYFIEGNTLDLSPFWSNAYTVVNFNGNGGQGTMNVQYFDRNAGAIPLSKNRFEREGYRFVGWNTKQDGTGDSYADVDYFSNEVNSSGATEVTLYAIWEPLE